MSEPSNAYPAPTKMSRIDNDIQRVQEMSQRVRDATGRVIVHARALGYFQEQPPETSSVNKLTAVSNTMQDAIADLDRALDRLSGSLNVFD